MTFQTGEIVKLKSGGPDMTVQTTATETTTHLYCQWFAGKKLESGKFPIGSLERVEQDEE